MNVVTVLFCECEIVYHCLSTYSSYFVPLYISTTIYVCVCLFRYLCFAFTIHLIPFYQPQDDDDEPSASIYIPTGNIDSYGSVPNEPEPRPAGLRMPTASSYSSSKSSGYSSLHYDTADFDSYSGTRCDSATAINLKTGTSVFSLDGPLSQPVKAPPSAKPKQLLPKSNSSSSSSLRKQKGSKKVSKDKKKKTSSVSSTAGSGARLNEMETEFCNALCITPFPSSSKEFDLDREGYSSDEDEMEQYLHNPIVFQDLAGTTKSVFRFEKLAYPDLVGGKTGSSLEGLYHRKFGVQRSVSLQPSHVKLN